MKWAKAFAPATVSNVAVGFDLMGYPVPGVGDTATVWAQGAAGEVTVELEAGSRCEVPLDPARNTAAVALRSMGAALGVKHGYGVRIKKGIPLGSGMGGSAASAVAAVVAANALLKKPLKPQLLIPFALDGEAAASGGRHPDNVVPSLLGGLRLCLQGVGDEGGGTWPSVKVPPRIRSVLVHPDLVVETKAARSILKPQVFLTEHVRQSALLAGFLTGCATGDLSLISHSLVDLIIEPQRQALIPGFDLAKAAALKAGALGCSISGSGPSLFAWAVGDAAAKKVARAMVAVFESAGLECESWCAPVPPAGARVVGRGKGVPK